MSTLERLFSYAKSIGAATRENFTTEALAGAIRTSAVDQRGAVPGAWADADARQETVVSWVVEPLPDGGGRITLVHDGWSEVGADSAARDDHEAYWSGYLDDLAATLAERA